MADKKKPLPPSNKDMRHEGANHVPEGWEQRAKGNVELGDQIWLPKGEWRAASKSDVGNDASNYYFVITKKQQSTGGQNESDTGATGTPGTEKDISGTTPPSP